MRAGKYTKRRRAVAGERGEDSKRMHSVNHIERHLLWYFFVELTLVLSLKKETHRPALPDPGIFSPA
jgi:hypothetical protein